MVLTKQKSEVLEVVLTTFNQELYEKNLKQGAYYEKLVEKVKLKMSKRLSAEEIAEALEETVETIEKLMKEL